MGNGAVAPHAAFTKTGHQAQRVVVNPSDTDADVITAFHPESETTRTLLYGSNYVEIQPSTANSNFGATQTFTFANDVDAIGDVWARVKLTLTAASGGTADVKDMALARVIDRVEVMVRNSTWQTMENSDLLVMAKTALHGPDYERFYLQSNGCLTSTGALTNTHAQLGSAATADYIVWVPLTIFNWGGPSRSHLTAGAPHQSFRIKLTYAAKEVAQGGTAGAAIGTASALDVSLWARQHVLTNFERDQIRGNTIAKNLRLTQHAEETAASQMNIELDSFSLLASHLLIAVEAAGDLAESTPAILKDAELLLNTSSHSGKLEGSFLATCAGAGMGLEVNDVFDLAYSAEGDRRFNLYVFPLASEAYGSDGCPMNRFDTIRLKLNFESGVAPTDKVLVTCVGTASAIYSKQAASLQYHS